MTLPIEWLYLSICPVPTYPVKMFSPNCSISSDDDAEGINVNEITVMLNSTFTNDELCYDPQIYVTTPKQLLQVASTLT